MACRTYRPPHPYLDLLAQFGMEVGRAEIIEVSLGRGSILVASEFGAVGVQMLI